MNHIIYIDGTKHHCTDPRGGTFYADHPRMPMRYCSQHHIGASAGLHITQGGAVRTSGHLYSMQPPMATPINPLPKPTPLPTLANPRPSWTDRKPLPMTYVVRALIVIWCLSAMWVYTR